VILMLDEVIITEFRDRPDIGHHFVTAHSDPRIGDGKSSLVFIRLQSDLVTVFSIEKHGVGQGFEAQSVDRIGGVGDEFSQEYLYYWYRANESSDRGVV
jgi:hypothetical protein